MKIMINLSSFSSVLLFFSIIDECIKICYGNKERAYERAVKEEKECYGRSKNRFDSVLKFSKSTFNLRDPSY